MDRHRLSGDKISNCFFPILFLLITFRLRGILWAWPFHFLGMTKNGHLVHFKTIKTNNTFSPFWFTGHMEVLRLPFIPSKYFYIGFVNGLKLYKQAVKDKNGH